MESWFHGDISREDAERILHNFGWTEGLFLVRLKPSDAHCYVLSVVLSGKASHFLLEKVDGVFLVNQQEFGDFVDLVELIDFMQEPRPHFNWPFELVKSVSTAEARVLFDPPPMDPNRYLHLWETTAPQGAGGPRGHGPMPYLEPTVIDASLPPAALAGHDYQEKLGVEFRALDLQGNGAYNIPRSDSLGNALDPYGEHQRGGRPSDYAESARAPAAAAFSAGPRSSLGSHLSSSSAAAVPVPRAAAAGLARSPSSQAALSSSPPPAAPVTEYKEYPGTKTRARAGSGAVRGFFGFGSKKSSSSSVAGVKVIVQGMERVPGAANRVGAQSAIVSLSLAKAPVHGELRISGTGCTVLGADGKTVLHRLTLSSISYACTDRGDPTTVAIVATRPTRDASLEETLCLVMRVGAGSGADIIAQLRDALTLIQCPLLDDGHAAFFANENAMEVLRTLPRSSEAAYAEAGISVRPVESPYAESNHRPAYSALPPAPGSTAFAPPPVHGFPPPVIGAPPPVVGSPPTRRPAAPLPPGGRVG